MIVALAVTAALYVLAVVRTRSRGAYAPSRAIVAFFAALVLVAGTSVGPVDALADTSLAWHMLQHLTISFAVAPLVLLGMPVRFALAALPARLATRLAGALNSRPARFLANPAIAWLQFAGVLYAVHFSPLYEAALEREPVHALEHGLFLGSALVFWAPVLAVAPAPHAPSHPIRLLMLFLALPACAFLGFIFYVTRGVLYPHYGGTTALADQANAGAVMWIAGGAPLLAALLWCVADWGARERRLGALADRQMEAPC